MRTLLLYALFCFSAHGTSLPYPAAAVEGYFFEGVGQVYPLTFEPGTLRDCFETSNAAYNEATCKLDGASMKLEFGAEVRTVIFETIRLTEGITQPSLAFYLTGGIAIPLPDGTSFESPAYLTLRRYPPEVQLRGSMGFGKLGFARQVFLKWPTTP